MKVVLTPKAKYDIGSIKSYISNELQNPTAAERLIDKILAIIDNLEDNPYMGTSIAHLVNAKPEYRFLVVKNYMVFYRVYQEEIHIVRVLYGKRNYVAILTRDNADIDNSD